ncbi:MAG: ribulose bisphosphate carboxylase small subunit [Gemmatimonadota bacterium]|nr:ribulose bisphosphate carboxylase small subunit [Gemmatimonadota bacterium]
MRITQGTFSFLADLTNEQIARQVRYALARKWAIGIEYTDDPHPRNTYWEMFGLPLFDVHDAASIVIEIERCRATFPNHYIRVSALDATRGTESVKLSFIVNRPAKEPGFRLVRTEGEGRGIRYSVESYAVNANSEGSRY